MGQVVTSLHFRVFFADTQLCGFFCCIRKKDVSVDRSDDASCSRRNINTVVMCDPSQRLSTAFEASHEYNSRASQRQKHYYDRKAHGTRYYTDDHVYLLPRKQSVGALAEFHLSWTGYMKLLHQITLGLCLTDAQTVHHNQL